MILLSLNRVRRLELEGLSEAAVEDHLDSLHMVAFFQVLLHLLANTVDLRQLLGNHYYGLLFRVLQVSERYVLASAGVY